MKDYNLDNTQWHLISSLMDIDISLDAITNSLINKGILTKEEIDANKDEIRKKNYPNYDHIKFMESYTSRITKGFTDEDKKWFKETAPKYLSPEIIKRELRNIEISKSFNDIFGCAFDPDKKENKE